MGHTLSILLGWEICPIESKLTQLGRRPPHLATLAASPWSSTPLSTDSFTIARGTKTQTPPHAQTDLSRLWETGRWKFRPHFQSAFPSQSWYELEWNMSAHSSAAGKKQPLIFCSDSCSGRQTKKTPQSLKDDTQWLLITKGKKANRLRFVWSPARVWFCITPQLLKIALEVHLVV